MMKRSYDEYSDSDETDLLNGQFAVITSLFIMSLS